MNQFKIGFENNLLNDIFKNKKDVSKEKKEILIYDALNHHKDCFNLKLLNKFFKYVIFS